MPVFEGVFIECIEGEGEGGVTCPVDCSVWVDDSIDRMLRIDSDDFTCPPPGPSPCPCAVGPSPSPNPSSVPSF